MHAVLSHSQSQPHCHCLSLSLAATVSVSASLPLSQSQPCCHCLSLSLAATVSVSASLPLSQSQPRCHCLYLSLAALWMWDALVPVQSDPGTDTDEDQEPTVKAPGKAGPLFSSCFCSVNWFTSKIFLEIPTLWSLHHNHILIPCLLRVHPEHGASRVN